ncbi:MAG: hypothetical protein Q9224_004724 [Gallowayella concinna]
MTITIDEWLSLLEDYDKEELLKHWEWDNGALQQHKFSMPFCLTESALQKRWPLKDLHDFCLKTCAIYATVDHDPRGLAHYLWKKWFRPGESPCRFGNAFARYIRAWDPNSPKTPLELLDAHRRICSQVLERQIHLTGDDDKPKPNSLDKRAEDPYENHENYRLETSFQNFFIIMDTKVPHNSISTGPSEHRWLFDDAQVLLVRSGSSHDLDTAPGEGTLLGAAFEGMDGTGNWRRLSLDKAVSLLMELHDRNKTPRAVLYE